MGMHVSKIQVYRSLYRSMYIYDGFACSVSVYAGSILFNLAVLSPASAANELLVAVFI